MIFKNRKCHFTILIWFTPENSHPQLCFVWLKYVSWFRRRVNKEHNNKINDDDCQISIRTALLNFWIRWVKRPRDLLFISWHVFVVTWLNSIDVTNGHLYSFSQASRDLNRYRFRKIGHFRSPDLLLYVGVHHRVSSIVRRPLVSFPWEQL